MGDMIPENVLPALVGSLIGGVCTLMGVMYSNFLDARKRARGERAGEGSSYDRDRRDHFQESLDRYGVILGATAREMRETLAQTIEMLDGKLVKPASPYTGATAKSPSFVG